MRTKISKDARIFKDWRLANSAACAFPLRYLQEQLQDARDAAEGLASPVVAGAEDEPTHVEAAEAAGAVQVAAAEGGAGAAQEVAAAEVGAGAAQEVAQEVEAGEGAVGPVLPLFPAVLPVVAQLEWRGPLDAAPAVGSLICIRVQVRNGVDYRWARLMALRGGRWFPPNFLIAHVC